MTFQAAQWTSGDILSSEGGDDVIRSNSTALEEAL
jgi:hypothetical protein